MLNLTRLHLGIAHESQFQGLSISLHSNHLVKAAEEPDKKDDRDRYADQPKQKTSTHGFVLLVIASQPNVGSELKFHGPSRPVATPRMAGQYGTFGCHE